MTAIRDALIKAGMRLDDTAELEKTARAALRAANGDMADAVRRYVSVLLKKRQLLNALALDHLQRIAASPAATAAGVNQLSSDTQSGNVPPAAAIPRKPGKKVKVAAHPVRQHLRRTHEQRLAEIEAMKHSRNAIYQMPIADTKLGDIAVRELKALVRDYKMDAASYLKFGTEKTIIAVLLAKIEESKQVTDDGTLVRDIYKPEELEQLLAEARIDGPQIIDRWIRTFRDRPFKEPAPQAIT